MNVLMKLEGAEELRKALKRQEKAFLTELAAALPAEGQNLMAVADAAAPRVTGQLVASSSVTSVVQPSKGSVKVAAAYLDEKAAAVHEGVHGGHHAEGTKHLKWFEHALHGFESGFVQRIAARLKRLVGGGS